MGRIDSALAALLLAWAALSTLPIGAWTGLGNAAHYEDAHGLWAATLLVVVPIALLALVVTRGAAAHGLARAGRRVMAVPRLHFLVGCGLLAAGEAAAVALFCFARQPQSIDAWGQWFQARILLGGSLVAPPPPSVAHFATLHMEFGPRGWFSQFPPLHPALLALGMACGAAWLVTPLLYALLPAAVFALGRTSGDERVARVAAGLTLLSPFAIALAASSMNHLPAALLIASGLAAVPGVVDGRPRAAAILGAVTGLCLGVRPADGAVLAAIGLVAVAAGMRRAGAWRAVAPAALAGLVGLVPTLLYNAATTGDALRYTYSAVWGADLRLGLGHAGPWGEPLTFTRALGRLGLDGHQMNVYLLEWPIPVMGLVAAGLWMRRGHLGVGLRTSAAYVLGLAALLFFYFHRDTMYGPRLLFSAAPALLVLTANALVALASLRRPLPWRGISAGDAVCVGLATMALVAGVGLVPRRLASYSITDTTLAAHPEADAAAAGLERAVVLLRDGWGSRLVARMWDAGLSMPETERAYQAFDACTLQELLDDAESQGADVREVVAARLAAPSPGRRSPGLVPDPALRLPADGRLGLRCVAEIARDREGTVQFAAFLHLNDPWLRGDVIWAREMGSGDAALADLFPERAMYRYVVRADGSHAFLPLRPEKTPDLHTASEASNRG